MKRFLLFSISVFAGISLAAQNFPNVLVDASSSNGECTMNINAKNPNYILGAENPCILYRSTDGGQTWTESIFAACGVIVWDVVLASDTAGHFYLQGMDNNNLFHTYRSDDYGLTWNVHSTFGLSGCLEDKSWMSVDRSPSSAFNGRIYSSWTLRYASGCDSAGYFFVQHSDDYGQTWSLRDTLQVDSSFVPPIGGGMACGPAGESFVTWSGGLPNQIRFSKSTDGGISWLSNAVLVDNNVQPNNDYAFIIDHSMFAMSPMTSLACDNSGGTHNGNLYCTWADLRNGLNNADIFLARSSDGGQSWATQRINDDTTLRHQILPQVAVDASTGWVYVSYTDARTNTDNFDDTLHQYLAWSSDGGQTFSNVQVSQNASVSQTMHSDYTGLDVSQGTAHLLWVVGRNNLETWTAAITQQQLLGVKDQSKARGDLILFPAYPNPSIDFTAVDFELSSAALVTLEIRDVSGKQISIPFAKQKYEPGRHQYRLEHSSFHLSPGTYFINLYAGEARAVRKMVVLH